MTNSMIPYSFIPGTKAKAGEVNANFIALAELIEQNKIIARSDIADVIEQMKDKADKQELINDHTVSEEGTNLNDYKTSGTYIFSSLYKPLNIPAESAGVLFVTGKEDSTIKQIWFCDGSNKAIYTRNYQNEAWSAWSCITGIVKLSGAGYLRMPNGLILEWGKAAGKTVTYPLAFPKLACPVFMKNGYGSSYERSDTGFSAQSLTGFTCATGGVFSNLNWVAMGY